VAVQEAVHPEKEIGDVGAAVSGVSLDRDRESGVVEVDVRRGQRGEDVDVVAHGSLEPGRHAQCGVALAGRLVQSFAGVPHGLLPLLAAPMVERTLNFLSNCHQRRV
jgi:hypothetical protein